MNLSELWIVLANTWQVIPVERFQKLVESMPRRVATIIKRPEEVQLVIRFCFHFDKWSRLVGALKHASVRARDTQQHDSVHAIYR
ncbi:hypothetical protein TNCV_1302541 [Trichonephila clavipes]|nr:hypothetical protein TNCV_1302541 [Trichonephila clavipes]